jgi:hypothetical protein
MGGGGGECRKRRVNIYAGERSASRFRRIAFSTRSMLLFHVRPGPNEEKHCSCQELNPDFPTGNESLR